MISNTEWLQNSRTHLTERDTERERQATSNNNPVTLGNNIFEDIHTGETVLSSKTLGKTEVT